MADIDDNTVAAVEKVLREPIGPEFSDKAWKIRTNLMLASSIGIAMALADLRIQPSSTVAGLQFANLTDSVVRNGLTVLIGYLAFHFAWVAWETLLEWRLRITGTRKAFVTGMTWESKHSDVPSDPRQSTFYNWWSQQAPSISQLGPEATNLKENVARSEAMLKERFGTNSPDWGNVSSMLSILRETEQTAARLFHAVEQSNKILEAARIEASLKRFDQWFCLFLRSQNLRWLLIDLAVPVLLAMAAIYLLQTPAKAAPTVLSPLATISESASSSFGRL